ncbi:MAG: hypothetical protein V4465_01130 [Patescibacteria group bacterium]
MYDGPDEVSNYTGVSDCGAMPGQTPKLNPGPSQNEFEDMYDFFREEPQLQGVVGSAFDRSEVCRSRTREEDVRIVNGRLAAAGYDFEILGDEPGQPWDNQSLMFRRREP